MNWAMQNRRDFFKSTVLSAGLLGTLGGAARAADFPQAAKTAPPKSHMKLGLVTYQLAEEWDIPTLIKNCTAAKFDGVELRTTHKHGVEVSLSKEERATVRKQFHNSKVELMGLGGIFDYHTPDQAKLRKDIEGTKEYIVLAQDVGATGIKVRPNGLPKEVPKEKTLEQIGRSPRELGEFAKDHGQVIRLEVHGAGTSLVPCIKTIMDVCQHPCVGACWNSNNSDMDGEGFDHNFNLLKDKIFSVHMRDLYLEDYPWRRLLTRLNEINFSGFCLAEIGPSTDPVRVLRYFRGLWLAHQGLMS